MYRIFFIIDQHRLLGSSQFRQVLFHITIVTIYIFGFQCLKFYLLKSWDS